jgi:hypothetical protein
MVALVTADIARCARTDLDPRRNATHAAASSAVAVIHAAVRDIRPVTTPYREQDPRAFAEIGQHLGLAIGLLDQFEHRCRPHPAQRSRRGAMAACEMRRRG